MKVLVVVDCQSGFKITDEHELVQNTLKKIWEFKGRNDLIIVLEYRGYNRTIGLIRDALKNYPDGVFLIKEYNDGSDEVENHLDRYDTSEIDEIQYECCGAEDGMEYATNAVPNIQKRHGNVCLVDADGPMY